VLEHRLQLVRQRIDVRDRETEAGIELVGDAERVSVKAQAQMPPVAVESRSGVDDLQGLDVGRAQRHLAELLCALADQACLHVSVAARADGDDPHRLVECPSPQDLPIPDRAGWVHRRCSAQLLDTPITTKSGDHAHECPKQVAIVCEPRVIMRAYHYTGA